MKRNLEKDREYSREYYTEHREHVLKRAKTYYVNNQEQQNKRNLFRHFEKQHSSLDGWWKRLLKISV